MDRYSRTVSFLLLISNRYIVLLSQPTVRAQFLSEWDSPKDEVPSLAKVYEIINPREVRIQHERYKRVYLG